MIDPGDRSRQVTDPGDSSTLLPSTHQYSAPVFCSPVLCSPVLCSSNRRSRHYLSSPDPVFAAPGYQHCISAFRHLPSSIVAAAWLPRLGAPDLRKRLRAAGSGCACACRRLAMHWRRLGSAFAPRDDEQSNFKIATGCIASGAATSLSLGGTLVAATATSTWTSVSTVLVRVPLLCGTNCAARRTVPPLSPSMR